MKDAVLLCSQRYNHYSKGPGGFQPPLFMVSLRVGARDFLGEGRTAQAARHDAASKALHQLKSLPLPEDSLQHCDAGIQENGKDSVPKPLIIESCASSTIQKFFIVTSALTITFLVVCFLIL